MAPINVLAAEAKGVELGATARRNNDGSYSVRSETRDGLDHDVMPKIVAGGFIRFECPCESGEARQLDLVPCWHATRVGRRLEREGRATWSGRFGGCWVATQEFIAEQGAPPDLFDIPEVAS